MSGEDEFLLVQITTTDETEAQHLAKILLEQRKAACISIVPKIRVLYHWHDKIETGTESLMLVKTHHTLLDEIIELVKTHHSYQLPEIIAIPLCGGSKEYLAWLGSVTQS